MGFRLLLGALAAVGVAVAVVAVATRDHWLRESSPSARGANAAERLGCWDCHRGAERADAGVPSLFGGAADDAAAIAERIRTLPGHPAASDAQRADLASWIALVRYQRHAAGRPRAGESPRAAAERLARRECFRCHGELGQGGVRNAGSLKGVVPGFFGRDFDALTRGGDPALLRQWIERGEPAFFREIGLFGWHPALWFSRRQQVKMPAYAGRLRSARVEQLVGYLLFLRSLGPLDGDGLARYRREVEPGRGVAE